jgi:hypothetical protein
LRSPFLAAELGIPVQALLIFVGGTVIAVMTFNPLPFELRQ